MSGVPTFTETFSTPGFNKDFYLAAKPWQIHQTPYAPTANLGRLTGKLALQVRVILGSFIQLLVRVSVQTGWRPVFLVGL